MSQVFYESRGKEAFLIKKKKKKNLRSEGKPLQYPNLKEIKLKTFKLKYTKNLSVNSKFILNSFKNKYLYYAIDDVLYLLKSQPRERDNLLSILYSIVLSVHNNLLINFFDIWIQEIYIHPVSKVNKFLQNKHNQSESFNYITVKLVYKPKNSLKKQISLW